MAAVDPFRAVQDDVTSTLADIQGELSRWRKLPQKSPKWEPARQRIVASLSELQVDLQDMQATIDIALKDPAKFALTPSELMTRQDFVRDLQAQANDARDLVEAPRGGGGLQASAAAQRNDRQSLLTSSTRFSDQSESSTAASAAQSAADHAAWADNEAAVAANQQQQEQIIRTQDAELGTIGKSLDRLGEMGKAMNEEMRAQGKALDEFADEVRVSLCALLCVLWCVALKLTARCLCALLPFARQVDDTSSKMTEATKMMKKMLKRKDRGKLCCICILSIVLIILMYLVFM